MISELILHVLCIVRRIGYVASYINFYLITNIWTIFFQKKKTNIWTI
jgi:hypothetical protein